MNPQMAEAKIKANMKDRSFMERFNSVDPVVRGEARQEMDRLHQQAYPGASNSSPTSTVRSGTKAHT